MGELADPLGPTASPYCDPLGHPAPPSVGKPYCGSVMVGLADLPLSATAIELSTLFLFSILKEEEEL
jgi:hypothetical protein